MINWLIVWLPTFAAITIQVLGPPSLLSAYPDGIPGLPALFGALPYGSYAAGILLPATSCCSSCSALGYNATIPSIFLIPYGTCAPDVKVYNAQLAGAKAVLLFSSKTSLSQEAMNGSRAYSVSLPSLLLGSRVYQDLVRTNEDVYLNITLELEGEKLPVALGIAFALVASMDKQIIDFLPILSQFTPVTAHFTPYYYIFNNKTSNANSQNCLFDGKYCSLDLLNGAAALNETIRQACAYQASLQDRSYDIYVNYMNVWLTQCLSTPQKVCFSAMGISENRIQSCFYASFEYVDNNTATKAIDNSILRASQKDFFGLDITAVPATVVGREMVYGDLNEESWNRAICAKTQENEAFACGKYWCAPGCWADMLGNGLCDVACNVTKCRFDYNDCVHPMILPLVPSSTSHSPANSSETSPNNSTNPSNTTTTVSETPTNSTAPPFNSSNPANTTHTQPVWQCSPGCTLSVFISTTCQAPCNVSTCDYQNWTCACARSCPPALLANDICDNACNTANCGYDQGLCSRISVPLPIFIEEKAASGDTSYRTWVIIACSVAGFV